MLRPRWRTFPSSPFPGLALLACALVALALLTAPPATLRGYSPAAAILQGPPCNTTDSDGDGILDDGDCSGRIGDNPCGPGAPRPNCDDNCRLTPIANQLDTDSDGFGDVCDNCTHVPNGIVFGFGRLAQSDFDRDGFGDVCDGDHNNDGTTNLGDIIEMSPEFGTFRGDPGFRQDIDMNGDERISPPDLFLTQQSFSAGGPGPSGLSCAGTPPCIAPEVAQLPLFPTLR